MHTPVDAACNDNNACTTDTCVVGTGCVNTPITYTPTACEVDCVCDQGTGDFLCGARNCDDQNACTTDTCDVAQGGCVNTPITCDDEDACTTNSCNPNSGCVYTEVDCSGINDQCNEGTCNAITGGCDLVPANEGDVCTTDDGEGVCTAGTCVVPTCGDVSGVVSASTGGGIAGASVSIGSQSTTTDGNGSYTILCVPEGPQTVNGSATGYSPGSTPTTVPAGGTVTANFSLVPVSAASRITVVLNWGGEPNDLDSHLSGPDVVNGGRFHVAWYQQTPVPYASLDVDDVDGNGPETVTVIRTSAGTGNFVPGDYHYWVHNYSTLPDFDVSNAVVTISKDGVALGPVLDRWGQREPGR